MSLGSPVAFVAMGQPSRLNPASSCICSRSGPWYLPKLPFRNWALPWTVTLLAGVRLLFPPLLPFLAELLEFSYHITICWKASFSMRTDNISEPPGFWLPYPSAPWLKLLFAIWTALAIVNFLGHSELDPCTASLLSSGMASVSVLSTQAPTHQP